jgi:archaellum biogenesis ATPase FlaH
MAPMSNQILEAALDYAARKISVIPVLENKKPPVGFQWQEFQTRIATETEIKDWYQKKWPEAQVAIVTGQISRLTVVDVENGGDISRFPETATARTGGGGYHFYYNFEPDLKNKTRILPLTDIRSQGGYVLCPPSRNEKGPYAWLKEIATTDFPSHLFSIPKIETTSAFDLDYPGFGKGERNDQITRFIGRLLKRVNPTGWESIVWPMIKLANTKNQPPLSDNELRMIFNSITGREKRTGTPIEFHEIIENESEIEILPINEVASKTMVSGLCFKTGFSDFDEWLNGGFYEGDLITISGQTGHGKTLFAQNLALNLSSKAIPVLFLSFEVMIGDLYAKFQKMGINSDNLIFAPLRIESGSIGWIEKAIAKSCKSEWTKVVVIDHLGFLLPRKMSYDRNLNTNYSSYLAGICRDLKQLALKNNLIIILLAHTRKTEYLTINDIGNSAGISQESDTTFLIERLPLRSQNKYNLNQDFEMSNESRITLAKNRKTGICRSLKFTCDNNLIFRKT